MGIFSAQVSRQDARYSFRTYASRTQNRAIATLTRAQAERKIERSPR
ncbi:MAG: hypothetical protein HC840_02450 [Leptolyngbyaceae cyanobacterium RM2_2_4]|nr:hypothetical protein [Leptolyngbyaceae cyanobacterium SM1_4_3]NJO48522.1 hypothetical protein [Leptolyngbyaceae cyanobacterium RM2_2_4]